MPLPALMLILLIVGVAGCAPDLRVTGFQLGRSLNMDKTVAANTTTFKPTDTVYISIATAGSGSGVLSVRWIYGTEIVGEPKKDVSFRGAAVTEFHLENVGGFPHGDYAVEVFLDGVSVGRRAFRVEKDAS